MHPIVALYLAIKRKKSGKFQLIPVDEDDFGVIKVSLVDGNIVGFDSTWGASLKSLEHMLGWRKAIVKQDTIDSSDPLPRMYVPRDEALTYLIRMELGRFPSVRNISYDEAQDLMKIRIGKHIHAPPDEIRSIKLGRVNKGRSFFLQRDPDYAAVFVAGKEIYAFKVGNGSVSRIGISEFPEDGVSIINSDHMVALTVSVPFFVAGSEISGKDVLGEVERLKHHGERIWHMLLSGVGSIYVSVLGYRGTVIGVFVLHGGELKMKGEKALKTIVETINLKGRLYEHGTDMRSS